MPPNTDIRDIKPLLMAPDFSLFTVALIALIVGAALFVAALYLRYRRNRNAAQVEKETALAEALRRLEELRPKKLTDKNHVRRWSFEISEVLRHFVLRQYDLPATSLTTEEILGLLPGTPGVRANQSLSLRSFLAATDAMKYAGHTPQENILLEVYERARSVVETAGAEAEDGDDAKENQA